MNGINGDHLNDQYAVTRLLYVGSHIRRDPFEEGFDDAVIDENIEGMGPAPPGTPPPVPQWGQLAGGLWNNNQNAWVQEEYVRSPSHGCHRLTPPLKSVPVSLVFRVTRARLNPFSRLDLALTIGQRFLEVLGAVTENPGGLLDGLAASRAAVVGPGLDAIMRWQPIITHEVWNDPAQPCLDLIAHDDDFDTLHAALLNDGWVRSIESNVDEQVDVSEYMFFLASGRCRRMWTYQKMVVTDRLKLRVTDIEDVQSRYPIAFFSRCCHQRVCTILFPTNAGGLRPIDNAFDRLRRHYLHDVPNILVPPEAIDVQLRRVDDNVLFTDLIDHAFDD
ncbi:hypothetical protein SISNIDRAFT_471263 [Sistotremastrum niveocremeum HHB9708]|uniref:Uncharacterized protein n=1 Tax=Sistotremastrum niveocremeum HHB9708 TaxID=1314777 RepID=A0A164MVY8_9AGAM|nr:hypothetical protein SISNIDRAFT_471263 [Sistotremastrum niveocremeum HHB9708]